MKQKITRQSYSNDKNLVETGRTIELYTSTIDFKSRTIDERIADINKSAIIINSARELTAHLKNNIRHVDALKLKITIENIR